MITRDGDSETMDVFSPPVREWFLSTFPGPTPAQAAAWGPIARSESTLLCAPTGSGKTLAAFLWALDLLGRPDARGGTGHPGTKVLYVSPLRALAVDVEKNLRSPLRGIELAASRAGSTYAAPGIGVRTGDTGATERRALVRRPPEILITTPESLYLMLTSQARRTLMGVRTVVVDEIHSLAGTKRGAHLSVSLERLEQMIGSAGGDAIQRIGLSATQRPLEVVAEYLGGLSYANGLAETRPVTILDTSESKPLDLKVVVPVADMGNPGERSGPMLDPPVPQAPVPAPPAASIWSAIHESLLRLVESHRSTIVFVNSRRLAERLASRLNELAREADPLHVAGEAMGTAMADGEPELVKAHHGSLSRERRLQIEDELKRGELRGIVATSSLELGIDMGAVDLVIQVSSPGSVAAGLQRVGRAGHQVGAPSRGRIFPRHRADLLESAVVARGMREGAIEPTSVPRNPLDVLAQQLVATVASPADHRDEQEPAAREWTAEALFELVRGSANFGELTRPLFDSVLDMLAGRYPAEDFAGLRPRLVWDRVSDIVRPRSGAQRLAVTNSGTIPDRGLFGVFLPDGTRVGELDEEMVYESRVGETFLLGASTWQIQEITFERVVVTPAPGRPGKMPFWHGDGPGRSEPLGRAIGELVRAVRASPVEQARAELTGRYDLDDLSTDNLLAYLEEQAEATGVVPDDRTLVVERFRDEIGDWRICVHSPFGSRVHAPWATALRARLAEHLGTDALGVEVLFSDDGLVIRLPEASEELPTDVLFPDPTEIDPEVVAALPSTSAFAARFRESAARALLLPRRRPDQRTPLWQQRQRASDLLAVAASYPSFPILLEATREMCNDVYDLPGLRRVLTEVHSRRIRVVPVETPAASPFARSLLFGWIAVYMYEGDSPLAERRAAALALDRELLGELLGTEELRALLDPDVLVEVGSELQRLGGHRAARDPDEVHDLLRVLGPLTRDEIEARSSGVGREALKGWLERMLEERRVIEAVMAGEVRLAAAEDAARLRDGLGVQLPIGLPMAFTEAVENPLRDLVQRHARTHGPFRTTGVAERLGVPPGAVTEALQALESDGTVLRGEFTPGALDTEWCDAEVLELLRRRTLAVLRRQIEPVESPALARFLPRWQGVGGTRRGVDAVADAVSVLQGAALVASSLESDVLGSRVEDYQPSDLDLLCSAGEVVWIGAGSIGPVDGRLRLAFRDQVGSLVSPVDPDRLGEPHHRVLREFLLAGGACFWGDLHAAVVEAGLPAEQRVVLDALWDLVWAGEVTGDTLAPLRARLSTGRASRGAGTRRSRTGPRSLARTGPPAAAGRWSSTAHLFSPLPDPTTRATDLAMQLLERYGVLTREMALGEGIEGGFAGIYPVLKVLEERGRVRRGYFVEGLGAAQFALPGAVDRLRAQAPEGAPVVEQPERLPWEPPPAEDEPDLWVLAATDPAQPYGAVLAWPDSVGTPSRSAGARVVVVGGEACAYLERGERRLLTFPAAEHRPQWVEGLASLVTGGELRRLRLETIDGEPASRSPLVGRLRAVGFADGYKGLTLGS